MAADWLSSSRPGYCNITLSDQYGSCEFGSRGAFGLPAAAATNGWAAAATHCLNMCAHCHRCAFVSVSPQYRDCSWYHSCDLHALHDAAVPSPAFRSNAVAVRAATDDPVAPSREYPSQLVRSDGGRARAPPVDEAGVDGEPQNSEQQPVQQAEWKSPLALRSGFGAQRARLSVE